MSQKDDILEPLQQVKYVGQATADQLYETLDIRGLADLVEAAENEQVQQLNGIGASREQDILSSARQLLGASKQQESKQQESKQQESKQKPRIDRFLERMRCPACGHDTFDRDRATMTCTACRRPPGNDPVAVLHGAFQRAEGYVSSEHVESAYAVQFAR